MSTPGREATDEAEPRSGAGAPADQVLVPEQEDPDEGNLSIPLLLHDFTVG